MSDTQPLVHPSTSLVGARFSASPRERSEREPVQARHAVPVLADSTQPDFVSAQLTAPPLGSMHMVRVILSVAKNLSSSLLPRYRFGVSSRARRGICFFAVALGAVLVVAAAIPLSRPHITGIGRVTISVQNHEAAIDFYSKKLAYFSSPEIPCERAPHSCFGNTLQILDVVSPSAAAESYLGEVDFRTPHLERMHQYLESQNVKVSAIVKIARTAAHHELDYFSAVDPEGHPIGFVQFPECMICDFDSDSDGKWHIIHAGFIVHDRAAAEHFYKDILGFRPYWHGGMKEDQTDWVSMQVPDGTDWLEFMVNVSPDADQRVRGIMNHIAIGVTDIHETEKRLRAAGAPVNEEPKIGRDGKWQLNLYDPDQTRIEFMEFTPVQKPCCSEFTGPHPHP